MKQWIEEYSLIRDNEISGESMFSTLAMFMPVALVGGPLTRPALAAANRATVIQMYWHIFPRDGLDREFNDPTRASTMLRNEYNVEPGQQQALGRYDMIEFDGRVDRSGAFDAIDPAQCVAQVADDGSCVYVYAQGTQPTGWRTRPDEEWNWMQPGARAPPDVPAPPSR